MNNNFEHLVMTTSASKNIAVQLAELSMGRELLEYEKIIIKSACKICVDDHPVEDDGEYLTNHQIKKILKYEKNPMRIKQLNKLLYGQKKPRWLA